MKIRYVLEYLLWYVAVVCLLFFVCLFDVWLIVLPSFDIVVCVLFIY